jgi:hypothetical protein
MDQWRMGRLTAGGIDDLVALQGGDLLGQQLVELVPVAQLSILAAAERIRSAFGVHHHRVPSRGAHPLDLDLVHVRRRRAGGSAAAIQLTRQARLPARSYLIKRANEGRFIELVDALAQAELAVLPAADHEHLALTERPPEQVVLTQRPPSPDAGEAVQASGAW